ncbi:hypothetical protein CT0861_08449 [Colletotrichum tofieldiae]|uniref:Uncharacterized protein n=1 Tax=Colletotrichum tofieldiae TaxID=708197 RepID=A0A166STJ1_9PEZI|nr:hypothetical protein CT0861_08449 [Colletotrichum tofieldiae]
MQAAPCKGRDRAKSRQSYAGATNDDDAGDRDGDPRHDSRRPSRKCCVPFYPRLFERVEDLESLADVEQRVRAFWISPIEQNTVEAK